VDGPQKQTLARLRDLEKIDSANSKACRTCPLHVGEAAYQEDAWTHPLLDAADWAFDDLVDCPNMISSQLLARIFSNVDGNVEVGENVNFS
jgi:hypothetical protein